MATKARSAGLLMYRWRAHHPEVLLVHPGGPFWAKKDLGAWSIPKGVYLESEAALDAAKREFQEETGFTAQGPFIELGSVVQPGGKHVSAWAFEGDCNPDDLRSNLCTIVWPPRSQRTMEIPEVDRAAWFSVAEARQRILRGQALFLNTLCSKLNVTE